MRWMQRWAKPGVGVGGARFRVGLGLGLGLGVGEDLWKFRTCAVK